MLLVYENRDKGISVEWKRAVHMPPHLHEAIEIVYVTNGNIALGVGLELYDMNEGDFAIVFPNVIHHYQVFGERENKVVFLHIDPAVLSGYLKELQTYSPENPVLKKKNMHPDVVHAINFLTKNPECKVSLHSGKNVKHKYPIYYFSASAVLVGEIPPVIRRYTPWTI